MFGRATIRLGIGPHSSFDMESRLKLKKVFATKTFFSDVVPC